MSAEPEPDRRRRRRQRGGGFADGGTPDGDKVVTILGAFGGDEQKAFEASLAPFEQSSGIDVQYVPDQDFTTTVKQKVNSGDAPDIGLFPQPGGILEFAADGKVQPIDTYLDYDAIDRSLVPGFLEAARYKGRVYGAPMRMAVKSIVWYPKPAYTDGKYSTSPASIQALESDVAAKIEDSGIPPWCMGWESDQATGWVGTDWLEEYMLRMYGPDIYDDWVVPPDPVQRRDGGEGSGRGGQDHQDPGSGAGRHEGHPQHRVR